LSNRYCELTELRFYDSKFHKARNVPMFLDVKWKVSIKKNCLPNSTSIAPFGYKQVGGRLEFKL